MKIVNVTPHLINFRDENGVEFEIPPSGVVLNAPPKEEPAGFHPSGVELVRVRFEADDSSLESLARLEAENPGAVIVGSIIAAEAFPGRVFAMVAAFGYERRPYAEKRMRPDKFTVF